MADLRTLQVKPETKERFLELGSMKDTQDMVLSRLLKEHENNAAMKAFWDKYQKYEKQINELLGD